ncbi:MAG: hypothetical protein RIQ60_589 [Pseudomonadota bacterium]|jgi:uncharacterized protein YgbK (DUF1537 family)
MPAQATPKEPFQGARRLHLLADDLTGALDSAAAFDLEVPVHLDAPPASAGVAASDIAVATATRSVVAVATASRDVPADTLERLLQPALPWFASADLAFKKVDSLLRGNTFAECAYLARAVGFDGVVFAPAFPGQRRVTLAGQQRLVAADAGRTPPPQDQVGPSMVEAFAALGLDCRTSTHPPGPAPDGARPLVWIPDVRSDADLQRVARLATEPASPLGGRWLWCGSAGLAQALAAQLGWGLRQADRQLQAPTEPPVQTAIAGTTPPPPHEQRPAWRQVLMLGASHHPVVRRQWQHLRQALPDAVHMGEGDASQFASACAALAGEVGVVALELSPTHALSAAQAAALLREQLAELVRCSRKPSTLLVVGGDTLLGVCRATGVQSLVTRPAARPGWGAARLVGGVWDGLTCHSRSGAFGQATDLVDILHALDSP